MRIHIRGCDIFFVHFFLSLLVFSFPLCFLFENGSDPVISFMSNCICIENKNNLKLCMFCEAFVDKLNLETL